MMLNNYEIAHDLGEIETIFNKSEPSLSVLWQNKNSGRSVYDITEISFNAIDQTCKVAIKPSSNALSSNKDIYLNLSHRKSIFRISEFKLDGQIIRFDTPGVVKALNTQMYPRIEFDLAKDDKSVELVCHHEDWAESKSFEAKIMNISQQGMCVVVADGQRYILEQARSVQLQKIQNEMLEFKVNLSASYYLKYRYRANGILNVVNRIGFQFESLLSKERLEKI